MQNLRRTGNGTNLTHINRRRASDDVMQGAGGFGIEIYAIIIIQVAKHARDVFAFRSDADDECLKCAKCAQDNLENRSIQSIADTTYHNSEREAPFSGDLRSVPRRRYLK